MKKLIVVAKALLIFLFADSQIKWDGESGDGLWNTGTNWVGNVVPGVSDNVLLDNSVVAGNYTVSLPGGDIAVSVNSLTITPTGAALITLLNPSANTSATAFTATGAGDAIVLNNGAIFKNSSGASGGTPISVTSTNFFRINNGGKYIHNTETGHTNNLVSRLSTVAGTENGTFEFDVPVSSYTFSFSDRTFGNLELTSTTNGSPVSYLASGSNEATVNGNLIINQDVTLSLNFTNSIIINGNLNQASASVFNISSGVATTPVKIKRHISSQGTIIETGSGIGQIELNGTSNQNISISGSITNSIELTINNPAGATLLSSVILPYNLQLVNGKIKTTAAATFTMIDNAIYSGGSPTSFIEGPMTKIGDEAFSFPVGIGMIYAPVGISGGGLATDAFTAEYKRINPQMVHGINYQNPIDHISYVEHWSLIKNSGSATKQVTLTVTEYSFAKVMNTLLVSRFNSADNQWKNEELPSFTSGPAVPPYVTGTITGNPVSTFGTFTIGTTDNFANNPLPINLVLFDAIRNNNNTALLKWELTECCSKHAKFELLKSKDGRDFNLIATVQGSETNRFYNYTDNYLSYGITYYRLKVIDQNGIVSYSAIVTVNNGMNKVVLTSIMPSIVNNTANVSVTSVVDTRFDLFITDMQGRLIKKQTHQLSRGNNTISISCEGLPGGSYILSGHTNSGRTNSVCFIKQ